MPFPPAELPTPPDAVQHRLARQSYVLRSVWFPSRNELMGWADTKRPVYFMPVAADRFIVGPRLGAMWASVFSPCFVGTIRAEGTGSRITWQRRLHGTTYAILAVWAALVVAWAVIIAAGMHPGGALWWGIMFVSTVMAPMFGIRMGGRALDTTIPWLTPILLAPDDEEDW